MTRYALYFAPGTDTPLWQAGCSWLGRDPDSDAPVVQPRVKGIAPPIMTALTATARRYGFHATLKAPFALAPGFTEQHLLAMADAFSRVQRPVALPAMQIRRIEDYLALCPRAQSAQLDALAMRCVVYFDALRAPPSDGELARRRMACLSPRQEALLQKWGYPYTEEEFRFHMTLSDGLSAIDEDTTYALRQAADAHFAPALAAAPGVIDGLTIFREPAPGAPLQVLARLPFDDDARGDGMPVPGRLFYVVGPSGVGKDSLLQWVQAHLGTHQRVRFATRAITRAAHPSEAHEPVAVDDFWQEAGTGGFSMIWQANGACYAVRRGIEAELLSGCDVVVNGSREYVPRVLDAFPQSRIVWVSADAQTIERRLISRQREHGAALLQRVRRATEFAAPIGENVIHLDNSGPLEIAGSRLLALLQQ